MACNTLFEIGTCKQVHYNERSIITRLDCISSLVRHLFSSWGNFKRSTKPHPTRYFWSDLAGNHTSNHILMEGRASPRFRSQCKNWHQNWHGVTSYRYLAFATNMVCIFKAYLLIKAEETVLFGRLLFVTSCRYIPRAYTLAPILPSAAYRPYNTLSSMCGVSERVTPHMVGVFSLILYDYVKKRNIIFDHS